MGFAKRNDGVDVLYEVELVEAEASEVEERVIDELFEHPTRDDVHEQREREQACEGVVHAHLYVAVRR